MTSDQDALETQIKRRILDAKRHLATLEHSASKMGEDFDVDALESAWASSDPEELETAYAIQAGYENVINSCITIGQELCRLEGWGEPDLVPSSVQILKLLHENGVISATTRSELKDSQESRTDLQHDYVNVMARELHARAQKLIEHGPVFLQDVALYMANRG